jgi:hypothetical protein
MLDPGLVCRLCLSVVFLWAGAVKATESRVFVATLTTHFVRVRSVSWAVAISIIAAELAIGAGLLTATYVHRALVGAAGLIALFTSVTLLQIVRGRHTPCHCFGNQDADLMSPRSLVRLAMLAGVCGGTWAGSSDRALELLALSPAVVTVHAAVAWGLIQLAVWLLLLPEIVVVMRRLIPARSEEPS